MGHTKAVIAQVVVGAVAVAHGAVVRQRRAVRHSGAVRVCDTQSKRRRAGGLDRLIRLFNRGVERRMNRGCCKRAGTKHDGRDLDGRSEGRAGVRREILEGGGDSGRQRDEIVGAERDFRRDQGLTGLVGGVLQQHRALARAL